MHKAPINTNYTMVTTDNLYTYLLSRCEALKLYLFWFPQRQKSTWRLGLTQFLPAIEKYVSDQDFFQNSLHAVWFCMPFCCLIFFSKLTFWKILSVIPLECQTVWSQIRPHISSGLTWVQTVCKGYQQTTKVAASKERIKPSNVGQIFF